MKLDKNHQRSLVVGLILSGVTGILIYIVGGDKIISEFDQGLTFIIGLTTMGALSAFNLYAGNQINSDRIDRATNINSFQETESESKSKI
ncbi:MAG: hypothetical protein MUD14_12075 [Hydrococcus sp. Prado102]|jgi:high-affinity Fe2+/Pb2+ permease|nr:hypothetical protein [Hydrococcus sp. Prado102]